MTWTAQSHTADDHIAPAATINDSAYKAPAARNGSVDALGKSQTYIKTAWAAQSHSGLTLTPIKAPGPLLQEKPAVTGTDNYVIVP